MKPDELDARLLYLAERIAEGAPIDWSDPATSEAALGPISDHLKVIEALATHLRLAPIGAAAGPPELEGFVIERELGSGGAGVVYLARDRRLERSVAIKVLPGEVALDPVRLARVEREAKLLASLNHPNIATIYDIANDARGSRVLLLEYVAGESLAQRLGAGSLEVTEALAVCSQIAEALAAAHEGGVIHRDLKPGNVMLGPQGRVKVLDFGLARRHEGEAASAEATIAGTWAYVSPECLTRSEDHRADVFAFGCVLYECLTGRRAFPGDSADEVLAAVIGTDPDWTILPRGTPASVRELLVESLARDPARRLDDMQRACHVLDAALREPGTAPLAAALPVVPGLPRQATSFIGREREIAECRRALEESRLVTLTGPGGSGKTRLAIQVAGVEHERVSQLVFVDLAPVSDGARVIDAVASTLEIRDSGSTALLDHIVERMTGKRTLIVLDNCEHVIDGCAGLLQRFQNDLPDLRVLATSREPLGIEGERRLLLAPLELPEPGADPVAIGRSDAVRLFVDRATRIDPGFTADESMLSAVVEICRRLEGLPLAIELAAGRVSVLSPPEIAARLDQQLSLLRASGRAAARHETMRAAIAWSVDELATNESRVFRSLSVFVGGWDLEGAMNVCGIQDEFEMLDVLSSLADKSLLTVERRTGEMSRYRFLEPIRQFALERLAESGEEPAARARHLAYFVALAERAAPELFGPDQAKWLGRLAADEDNFATALETAERTPDGVEAALRIVTSIHRMWTTRGRGRFGEEACLRALARAGESTPAKLRARAHYAFGRLLWSRDVVDRSRISRAYQDALELFRSEQDLKGMANCLVGMGMEAGDRRDHAAAQTHFEQALELNRQLGHIEGIATISNNLGVIRWMQGDLQAALELIEEAQRLRRSSHSSPDRSNAAITSSSIAYLSMRLGRRDAARTALAEALDYQRDVGSRGVHTGGALLCTADFLASTRALETSARLYGAAEALYDAIQAEERGNSLFSAQRDELIARVKGALGETSFEAAFALGKKTPPEDAVRMALEALEATTE